MSGIQKGWKHPFFAQLNALSHRISFREREHTGFLTGIRVKKSDGENCFSAKEIVQVVEPV